MTVAPIAAPGSLSEGRETRTSSGFRWATPAVAVSMILVPTATSTITAAQSTHVVVAGTFSDMGGFQPGWIKQANSGTSPTADAVRRIRASSGLTWDELGRALGVSRRAVHAWANGGRLNQVHAARLGALAELVEGLGEETPERARAALYAPGPGGLSPYQLFIRSFAAQGNRREGFAPWELLAGEE